MILPIIMAGGSGSRLWPLSRQQFPKQFLTLLGNHSMLQTTANRLQGIAHSPALVICNEEHRFSVAEQFRLKNINNSGIILEPVGRNTAPAIALAAMLAVQDGDDPILLVLAADHVIKNESAFCETVKQAVSLAEQNKLVTFGIVPTAPETGYGYIQRGDILANEFGFNVAHFVEKPNLSTAQDYIATGQYYWNSGMFLFKASAYLQELALHSPDIFSACEAAMTNTTHDADFIRIDNSAFEACPDDSIDYAVMEKTRHAVVVPMDCGWSDVGSWTALWEIEDKDEYGNVFKGDVIGINTQNTYVNATEKLVTVIGLDDVVVVETKDAILIAKQSEVQQVKQVVEQLKSENRNEWQHHREVYRPWGKYDSIDHGGRFQVKRITVKPGAKLSVQMHHHRAEHWIVVTGTAKVTNGENELLLTENQSTYIPVGAIHALENPGKVPLELIEVQSGSYLGEDDIVRFDDRYGRVDTKGITNA
ncbi:mannose-1-phosphate guanylyltransferase/mannose-6-phosphate isomerase [Shewanella sp. Actino-trap-3]|jgi:mannose-1-phosphate guanylyltransferase|uniref:mannose-1-phosphate guanylyltransferase/mannose-6-phosphate isomerase n=1 Tax=Shewanella sp. Actino-trap-3 TaxID=2058331 RepID=UPI000C34DEBC|nr:mannose-1-phosphate guanylyltransferase/mannose-6-phosphate isomerase [Shewanella sp. Actino-trap-3]PKG78073.1 mannose-1-phosphate guanylyltransferase/mannose-6-phosphate isomerase [Shewanella sp. Actino-trap-3]|tara:strand:+ start:164177 stop:165610 length:1434 start_codon:yes stop_codon:yes gene_type:complete